MKKVTVHTRQKERPNELRVDNGILFCIYCNHSIDWNRKSTVDNHCNSKAHLANKKLYESQTHTTHQQTLQASISANETKKNCGAILQATTLQQLYLPRVFTRHYETLFSIFTNKPIAIIMDKTTDDCSRSVKTGWKVLKNFGKNGEQVGFFW
ncbi:11348_t:CDS:2 [Gigaspora rosea]|nr:11348_t:CDS:2 [Gigaspora rosea]